jgi:hypothetical protein
LTVPDDVYRDLDELAREIRCRLGLCQSPQGPR